MIAITRHATPITVTEGEAVLQLVSENVTSLSMTRPPVNHPFFSAYKLALVHEVRAYLSRPSPSFIEIITAASADGEIIGFLLYGLSDSAVVECSIYYTAVDKRFRGQGLMSLMMRELLRKYPISSLSCNVELVPVYERFGYKPISVRDTHIVMVIGDPKEVTSVLDTSSFMSESPILAERAAASARAGDHAVKRANKILKKDLDARKTRAKQFLKARG
tara:strand:+ start:272 stop:928 length:657 start_codon:yes stop_codon:yes gene_type:complete